MEGLQRTPDEANRENRADHLRTCAAIAKAAAALQDLAAVVWGGGEGATIHAGASNDAADVLEANCDLFRRAARSLASEAGEWGIDLGQEEGVA